MRFIKTKATGLILLGLCLAGAEDCEESQSCAQGPEGPLSAWSECELYPQTETIWLHLTNQESTGLSYLSSCQGPLTIEYLGDDGAFHALDSGIQCASDLLEWVPLPAPGEIDVAAWPVFLEEGTTLPPGTYRGAFYVGSDCTEGQVSPPADAYCSHSEVVYSQAFSIYSP